MPTLRVVQFVIAVALIMPMAACVLDDVNFNQADTFTCTSDEDCLEGFECDTEAGFCREPVVTIECFDNDNDGARVGPQCPADVELDCDDENRQRYPGNPEICDNVDNDCDEEVDEDIQPVACPLSDGVCGQVNATQSCVEGELTACDYGENYVEDETIDYCDNLDNDCDGEADEVCPTCTAGEPCNTGGGCGGLPDAQCACKVGTQTCTEQGTPDECLDGEGNPVVFPFSRSEIAGNSIDDDCDGTVD